MDTAQFLAAGVFIDSDSPQVIAFAKQVTDGALDQRDAALRLYTAIRDGIIYDPYVDLADPSNYRASGVLAAGRAFCIGKSALLAASARVVGIPARVGYADVRNHLTSPRFYEKAKTDKFIWHSYTELYLSGRWVKATPAFDRALCDRLGLEDARVRRRDGFAVAAVRPLRPSAYGISERPRHLCRRAVRHHPGRFSEIPIRA